MTEEDKKDPAIPALVTMGHPKLALPAKPVKRPMLGTNSFARRLDLLHDAMEEYSGIGIAAPQIGWFERFFLMMETTRPETEDEEKEQELLAWVNPEIVDFSEERVWAWEGCLSVPGLRGWIQRPAAVAVRGYDESGDRVSREFTGWNARIFQHEFDHLEGMLYPYRVKDARHLIHEVEMLNKADWPEDWPAPGARDTDYGETWSEDD